MIYELTMLEAFKPGTTIDDGYYIPKNADFFNGQLQPIKSNHKVAHMVVHKEKQASDEAIAQAKLEVSEMQEKAPTVIREEKPKEETLAHKIWRTWSRHTQRKDDMPEQFAAEIEDISGLEKAEWRKIYKVVQSAAFLNPGIDDEHDYQRLIDALSEKDIEDIADKLSKSHTKAITYAEAQSRQQLFEEVLEIIENPEEYDTKTIWDISRFDKKVIQNSLIEETDITPEALLEMLHKQYASFYPISQKINWEKANEQEQKQAINDVNVYDLQYKDLQVKDMIDAGYPDEMIIAHHFSAPEGYWERVYKELIHHAGSILDVYDNLEPDFNFHPEDRVIPPLPEKKPEPAYAPTPQEEKYDYKQVETQSMVDFDPEYVMTNDYDEELFDDEQ